MRPIDVIMPTLGKKGDTTVKSVAQYVPGLDRVIDSYKDGWAAAINECLAKTDPDHDVLIIDDDVTVLPDTFKDIERWYDKADVFGFKLMYPDGTLQHDGGYVTPGAGSGHIQWMSDLPSYVAYVTASLCLVKREVFSQVARFKEWPGLQWEDVAFCLDAWACGYKVLYVPNEAIHEETGTKRFDTKFSERFVVNASIFRQDYEAECVKLSTYFGIDRRISHEQRDVQPI